jgi:hypothetical protein
MLRIPMMIGSPLTSSIDLSRSASLIAYGASTR